MLRQDSWPGKPGQYRWRKQLGWYRQDRIAGTGQPGQDNRDRTAMTVQSGQTYGT
jgi:hypothetical protein